MLVPNTKLLIAITIIVGGVLLLLPQNGVMAWMESGSLTTLTDKMNNINKTTSDQIVSSVEKINNSVDYSSKHFAVLIIETGEGVQTILSTLDGIMSQFDRS